MNHQPNYTHPWHDDELCRVNGIPLCYRFNFDNEIEVMMPGFGAGGRSKGMTPNRITRLGMTFTAPKFLRDNLLGKSAHE